jgi:dephospho-CoA kinase
VLAIFWTKACFAIMTLIIGLTGGIGSGKSTVAEMFSKRGANIIDTDVISHQLTAPGQPAVASIEKFFGKDIIAADGGLDRVKLRHLVFSDATAKKFLEDLLHPLIREQVVKKLSEKNSAPYRIVVVPLLFETNAYEQIIQRSLLVDCPEQLQLTRATSRGRLNEAEVQAVMATQYSRKQRLDKADDVILNDGAIKELEDKVMRLNKKYLSLA